MFIQWGRWGKISIQRFLDNVKSDFRGGIVLIFRVVNTCGCEFIDQKGAGLYG